MDAMLLFSSSQASTAAQTGAVVANSTAPGADSNALKENATAGAANPFEACFSAALADEEASGAPTSQAPRPTASNASGLASDSPSLVKESEPQLVTAEGNDLGITPPITLAQQNPVVFVKPPVEPSQPKLEMPDVPTHMFEPVHLQETNHAPLPVHPQDSETLTSTSPTHVEGESAPVLAVLEERGTPIMITGGTGWISTAAEPNAITTQPQCATVAAANTPPTPIQPTSLENAPSVQPVQVQAETPARTTRAKPAEPNEERAEWSEAPADAGSVQAWNSTPLMPALISTPAASANTTSQAPDTDTKAEGSTTVASFEFVSASRSNVNSERQQGTPRQAPLAATASAAFELTTELHADLSKPAGPAVVVVEPNLHAAAEEQVLPNLVSMRLTGTNSKSSVKKNEAGSIEVETSTDEVSAGTQGLAQTASVETETENETNRPVRLPNAATGAVLGTDRETIRSSPEALPTSQPSDAVANLGNTARFARVDEVAEVQSQPERRASQTLSDVQAVHEVLAGPRQELHGSAEALDASAGSVLASTNLSNSPQAAAAPQKENSEASARFPQALQQILQAAPELRANPKQVLELVLNPEGLGRIKLRLEDGISGQAPRLEISGASPLARTLLNSHLQELRAELSSWRVDVSTPPASAEARSGQQNSSQSQDHSRGSNGSAGQGGFSQGQFRRREPEPEARAQRSRNEFAPDWNENGSSEEAVQE